MGTTLFYRWCLYVFDTLNFSPKRGDFALLQPLKSGHIYVLYGLESRPLQSVHLKLVIYIRSRDRNSCIGYVRAWALLNSYSWHSCDMRKMALLFLFLPFSSPEALILWLRTTRASEKLYRSLAKIWLYWTSRRNPYIFRTFPANFRW